MCIMHMQTIRRLGLWYHQNPDPPDLWCICTMYHASVPCIIACIMQGLRLLSHNPGTNPASPNWWYSCSMVVLVLDEVDRLLAKGTEDLYKLFMLPQTPGVRVRDSGLLLRLCPHRLVGHSTHPHNIGTQLSGDTSRCTYKIEAQHAHGFVLPCVFFLSMSVPCSHLQACAAAWLPWLILLMSQSEAFQL